MPSQETEVKERVGLKLDVGCGARGTIHNGFVGIDIWPEPSHPRKPGNAYVRHDFVKQVPRDEWMNAEIVVAFHIIEHLHRRDGVQLLRNIRRVLAPGKQAFVSCPDLALFIRKYEERDMVFWTRTYPSGKDMWPGRTLADRFNYQIHQATHIWSYDQETLIDASREAGFESVEVMPKDHYWCRRPDHEIGVILTK